MARRRGGDTEIGNDNEKEEEEIDIYRTVFIDTNLDTHLAVVISELDFVFDLKKKVVLEHFQCFPKLGEISIQALKVKRKGHFYHLSDSMRVNRAFEGVKNCWFLSVDASCLKQLSENEQSCRPNMSNQLPVLCLPYNLSNAECNTDDASTSAILKSASAERLRNQKVQLIPGDSCREFSEDIVTDHKCTSTEILKNLSADLDRVPDLPAAGTEHGRNRVSNVQCSNSVEPSPEIRLPVKKKKQKITNQNVDELGDSLAKENIATNHVSGGDALRHEILLSANMSVHAEKAEHKEGDALQENRGLVCASTQKTSKQETILPQDQHNSQIVASNTISPESTDTDHMTMSLYIENTKSKKKRKRHEMKLSSADNHERASFPLSIKDFAVEDKVKEKNIPLSRVTGKVLSPPEILVPAHLLVNTERKEHKEIRDPLKEDKALVSTSKQEIELPRNSEEQKSSPKIVLDTLSSEPADNQHLRTSPGIKNTRGEKTRKKDATFNVPSVVLLPSSTVQAAGGEESFQEKNIASNHVSGEDESHHEVAVPLKENKVLVSTNETSTQEIGMTENSIEDRHDSQKIAVDTLSSEAADNEHLRTGTSIKNKKNKKKRKTDSIINISNSIVLPSSAKDNGGAENLNENNSALNYVSAEDEARPRSAVLANLLVEREKIRDSSEQDKDSVSLKKTSAQGTGLTGTHVEDQHTNQIVVSGSLFPEPADNEHLRTNSSIKHNKSKKKSKRDTTFSSSSAIVLPSSAQDVVGEESLKEKTIALNNVSGKDESRPNIAVPANLLVDTERTEHEEFSGDHIEKNKGSVSNRKDTSTQETGLKVNSEQDQDNSQKVVVHTLSPELADSEHLGTNSSIKNMKKKKKRKMDATFNLSSVNVLPSSVQNAAREDNLKEKNIPSHKDESHPEIVIPANLLVNAERSEHEEITGDSLEKNRVRLNLDSNTARISKNVDSVKVQSANMIKDKSRKDQTNFNSQSQPAVSERGSDRIDFKHYFLPGKTEDKVADSDKNGITRSERVDKTKKNTKKMKASLKASHDQEFALRSCENQEGGVKSHVKCSSDIDPQESFSMDASSRSLHPSKKSTSNIYQNGLPSSYEPDQARTPHSVLRAIGRGVSVNSTPAPAHRKGKKGSSAASSSNSSSESFDKSHQGTKSKNRVSNADRRLVASAKASTKGTSEVKSRPPPRKSLLTTPGFIFKDDSSESSDDEGGSEQLDARTPSDDVLSSDSDKGSESEISLDSPRIGSSGLGKKEDGGNTEKKRSSNLRNTTMDMILRGSSLYKKAKLTAESQPEVEDSESQPVDCVPDSQANP